MKQAILIMAHKNRAQLEKLIRYFEGKCDIIIHLDKNSKLTVEDERGLAELPGVVRVFRKVAGHWGSYKLLLCQLCLLEQALKNSDCRYVHLISGQDYPIKPLCKFLEFFDRENKEFIGGVHLPNPRWDGNTYRRIQYYFLTDWFRPSTDEQIRKIWKSADFQEKLGIRRGFPRQIKHLYGGSAWFSLTRACAEAVVQYTHKHRALLRRFRFTFVPDEMFIQTVVRNLDMPNIQIANSIYRFIHWEKSGDYHPANLDEALFFEVSSSHAFFARKYEYPSCKRLMDLTDQYLIANEALSCSETGAWTTRTFVGHTYDPGLSKGIALFCKVCKIGDVIDLGCGPGWYVEALRRMRIAAVGYDGNPNTEDFSRLLSKKAVCKPADLTDDLIPEEPFGMTLFLSVGEYIPKKYEGKLWENLVRSTNRYLVVAWGEQLSPGVVNPHAEDEVVERASCLGLVKDELATYMLREYSSLAKHKRCLVVFVKSINRI